MSKSSNEFSLSVEELSLFDNQGFLGPFDAYSEEEMDEQFKSLRPKLIDHRDSAYGGSEGLSGVTNLASYDRHLDIDFLDQHIRKPEIVDRVTSVVGDDVLVWRSEFFPKYPGDEGTDWHQASNFASIAGDKKPQIVWPNGSDFGGTITVWTAFTESTIDNGCLQFIPGTHKQMNYDETKDLEYNSDNINKVEKDGVNRGFFGYDYRDLQIDPHWKPDEDKAWSLVMRPGQFVMFWSTLMHASHPHSGNTQSMRLGFAARYLPTSVQVYPHSKTLAEFGGKADLANHRCVMVAGEDSYGHNRF